jgi:N-acyl-D-aspartate/D-glutamate deacylase
LSAFIILVFSSTVCKRAPKEFDILIKNGKIVDGTGNPWFYGDIGIIDDTIVEIGSLDGREASKVIDAEGLVVCPGFIDTHTHCDMDIGQLDNNANLNYLTQGVTTVVTGNCGESVSLKVKETKSKWEKQGIGTNIVFLVGHGTIRREVIGEEPREASVEEIEKMKAILWQAMKEGAWGMSTGLEYIPGRYANTKELIELAKVVNEFGGIYTSHIRDEDTHILEAIKEIIRIGKESGVRVNVAHFKICGKENWGMMKDAVKLINEARVKGIYITADQYPYIQSAPIGPILSILEIPEDMMPLMELRRKMRGPKLTEEEREKLGEQYLDELKKALSNKSKRERIRKLTLEGLPNKPSAIAQWGWHNYTILVAEKNKHLMGKNISDLAREQKRDAFDIVVSLILDEPDMLYSGGSMSEEDLQLAIRQNWVMVSSDGSARPIIKEKEKPKRGHPRAYGSFTKVLRKYVREKRFLSLENAIRKMTSLPASLLQMRNRGLLLIGYKADIVIFDPETVRDNATYANCRQYSSGIEYVIIGGKISIERGQYTGTLNGKVLLLTKNI